MIENLMEINTIIELMRKRKHLSNFHPFMKLKLDKQIKEKKSIIESFNIFDLTDNVLNEINAMERETEFKYHNKYCVIGVSNIKFIIDGYIVEYINGKRMEITDNNFYYTVYKNHNLTKAIKIKWKKIEPQIRSLLFNIIDDIASIEEFA